MPQRARGKLLIEADVTPSGQQRCAKLRQEGSFRALFPRVAAPGTEAVMLNTAGGITGGDHFQVRGVAHDNAKLTITTQAAERIYRAINNQVGTLHTTLSVGQNARLNWMPQETILFDGSALSRRLTVDLAESATFLMVEPVVFGRLASHETITSGFFDDRILIQMNGSPLYRDGCRMVGDMAEQLARKTIGNGAFAMANVLLYDQSAAAHLDSVRALLPQMAGATLLRENLIAIRVLASDSFLLRKTLVPVLTHLNNNTLPKNWRL